MPYIFARGFPACKSSLTGSHSRLDINSDLTQSKAQVHSTSPQLLWRGINLGTHTHTKYSDVIKASFISLATEDSIIWLEFTSLASLPHFSPSFSAQPTPAQTDQLFLMQAESFPLHASTPDVQPSPESPNSTPFPGLATLLALPEFSKKVLGL